MREFTLQHVFIRFKWRIIVTFSLVILESLLDIFYPLLIGLAINDLLDGEYSGIIYLASLGLGSLTVGSIRRFYDTRVYSGIYCEISPELVEKEHKKGSSLSKVSARSNLITEFVEFLENSMPEIIGAIVSLIGIISIIATLDLNVFYACIGLLILVFVVYAISGRFNYKLNEGYNNQLEMQVEALTSKNSSLIKGHFKALMKWNIKLSDLETVNYFLIWLGVIALFIFTPITVIESGVVKYGLVFSVLLYVFNYIDTVVTFPIYIQQLIRLKEISRRLAD